MSEVVAGARRLGSIPGLFSLHGESWMRHANPVSVWTGFAVLSLLVVSICRAASDRLVVRRTADAHRGRHKTQP